MRNIKQFKQILIDVENYNALKDLGKTGDSFNDIITMVLCFMGIKENKSNTIVKKESVIKVYEDDKYFKILINNDLRKAGVDRIEGYKENMDIVFLGDEGNTISIKYPDQIENLPQEVESELLDCGMGLPNYVISRIVGYVKEYVMNDIKKAIKELE